MNIETVNELIKSLESAGELSIKERKYLDLAKAYADREEGSVALALTFEKCRKIVGCPAGVDLQDHLQHLAAENVVLKAVFSQKEIPSEAVDAFMDTAVMDHDWNETSEWSWVENETEVIHAVLEALKPETPATDAYLAVIKADGVALAKSAFEKHIQSPFCYQDEMVGMESALSIACQVESQLREGAK